ncbi:leucine-rich repeat-containing protein 27 [Archocentrus centrarchus]|uniref:leucine-rich repeat-containing protein 27 n=1 Tax=Archocentrus centrarchus TaxID=63155 RepID=UPI0011E9BE74|nr:leucine-rich repeat-containing protein 27 [Archocentrus centrarchus]
MTSPEKEAELPGAQLSFVFGSSVIKPPIPRTPPEDAEPQEPAESYSAETLCLSRSQLKHVPDSLLRNSTLKYLTLEGNQITSIPGSMFISLPNLMWLDLRKNLIESIPAEIGSHRSLKTLLLEGNPISELPAELGNVITLKGLNLRDCPIHFPPQDVVQQGLLSILQYLRSALAQRPVSARKTPPELPEVEKLQLSELRGSSVEEQDESGDVDELQRFKELKHQLILLESAELGSVAQYDKNPRKKTTTKAGIIPQLPLLDSAHWNRPEERRQAAMKELNEKKAILEQKRKSQEALQKWRTQARITQEKKMSEHKQKKHQRQRRREKAEVDSKPGLGDSGGAPWTFGECEGDRSARELERQIHARVEKIQERCRNPRGTASEQMAAAAEDVEEMRKLQMRLLRRKRTQGQDLEKAFILFTGDTWPSFSDK